MPSTQEGPAERMTPEDCLEVLVDSGTVAAVPLDQLDYRQAMLEVVDAWKRELGPLSRNYFLAISGQLAGILSSPEEWRETGRHLLDATMRVFGNGSHQFICHAVPSLFTSGVVQSRADLHQWVDALVETINPMQSGEHLYARVAERINSGRVRSIAELRALKREDLTRAA